MKILLRGVFALLLTCVLSACSSWKVSTGDYENIDKIAAVNLEQVIGESLRANNIHNLTGAYAAKAVNGCTPTAKVSEMGLLTSQDVGVAYLTQNDGEALLMQTEAMQVVLSAFAAASRNSDVSVKAENFGKATAANPSPVLTYSKIKSLHEALEKSGTTSSLVFYETAYYEGKFVTRFGDKLGKPKFDSGISDTALNQAFLVLLENAADMTMKTPAVHAASDPKVYPGTKEVPTVIAAGDKNIANLKALQLKVADKNGCGITETEARFIRVLSNKVADQVTKRAAGLLEALHSVDVGFAVLPNFAIGSNETLMLLAKTLIEVAARRATQHLLTEALLRYDVDLTLPD